jgi:hypothetical protein
MVENGCEYLYWVGLWRWLIKFERRLPPKETLIKLWWEAIFGQQETLE